MPKPKRKNKTKEELVKDIANQYEQSRQRAFVKNTLYPFLIENSKSVHDAKNICVSALVALRTSFHAKIAEEQKRVSVEKTSYLEIPAQVDEDKKETVEMAFLKLFDDERIATTETLLDGLDKVIQSFEREESTKRPLSSLPAELLD